MIREKITLRRLLVFIVLVGLVVAVVLFLLNREERLSIGPLGEIPGSPDYSSVDVGQDDVVFSNGRFIADYSGNMVEKLSNTEVLPPIDVVERSPGGGYILFRTDEEKLESPSLFDVLNEDTVSAGSSYWWVAEAKTGKVSSVFTDNAYTVKWSQKDTLIYTAGEALIEYDVAKDSYDELGRLAADIVDFKPYENSIMVLTADQKMVSFTISSSDQETVYEPATAVGFSGQEGCFIAFHGHGTESGEEHSDVKLVGCGDKVSEIEHEFVYTPRFTDDNSHFIFFDSEVYRYIDLATGKNGILESPSDLSGLYLLEAPSLSRLVFMGDSSFLMSDNSYSYSPISANQSTSLGEIVIDFFKSEQAIEASKEGDYSDKDKAAVVDKVSSEGYDPDLYTIVFNVLEPEGYRW